MKFPRIQGEGLVEQVLGVIQVEQVVGGRLVEAEHPDFPFHRSAHQRLVTGECLQRADAKAGELGDTGVASLHAHQKTLQGHGIDDTADAGMGEDRHRDRFVRRRKIECALAFRGPEDGIDDCRLLPAHALLCGRPVASLQVDGYAGLPFPQPPAIDQITREGAAGIAKHIGRIVVVDDHGQRSGQLRRGGIAGSAAKWQQHRQREEDVAAATHAAQPNSHITAQRRKPGKLNCPRSVAGLPARASRE